jgi:putative transcriptional regulator
MQLADVRTDLALSQAALAEKLGVSPGHIGDIERGHRKLTIKLALRLESIFGLTGIVAAVVAKKIGDEA